VTGDAGAGVRVAFHDPIGDGVCVLVVPLGGKAGVEHPGCDALADLALDLDAFFCPRCHRNGRVSGAWAADVIRSGVVP